jgi:3-oxoacyl-[acyl-carrier-protein] synthase-3
LGVGSYQPDRIVTNDELAQYLDTSDDWIRQRVGIVERRFAADSESVVDMAVAAGRNALADAGIAAQRIGAVIVANCSMPNQIPNAAARVAQRIGAISAGTFDLNAGCAGFCYALAVASDVVRSGSAEHVLVVGAEKLTDVVDPLDRSTAIIFADGAGAMVVGASPDVNIGPVVWGHRGDLSDALSMPDNRYVHQDGKTMFRFATDQLPKLALRAVAAAGLGAADVDVVVSHQANLRIIRATERHLRDEGLRADVVVAEDIQYSGNTSAASIPIALDHLRQESRVCAGDIVVTVSVGAGLAYAGQVFVCP